MNMRAEPADSARIPNIVPALVALLLVACGDADEKASSAASATATPASSGAAAATSETGSGRRNAWTATVTLEGKTMDFDGQQCLGSADNFAFIGFVPDGDDSFEIQAAPNAAGQEIRLFVGDQSYLGGEITDIDVGDWHAAGSARFPNDGVEIDFDVSCR
jgi:hypothetical protein